MNSKIVGKFFQSEDITYNYGHIDNPKLLSNIYFEKVDFEPIVPIPILHKKAKITDLISCVNATSGGQLVLSKKLKNIIEKHRTNGLQFFKTSIIKDNVKHDDYFLINIYELNMEFIDFEKSTIYYEKQCEDYNITFKVEKIIIDVKNVFELLEYIEIAKIKAEMVLIEKLALVDQITEHFFILKYVTGKLFFISEKLKKEIEDAGCTGIEFQPAELSLNEWLHDGHREKIYGKS